MNNYILNIKQLFLFTFVMISLLYYYFLTPSKIIELIQDEYIIIGITILLIGVFSYLKFKLREFEIISYLPNLYTVPLKSTLIFFLIFQVVDYYFEDGFMGMISQWIIYWIFGLLAWVLTHNINLYKNYKFYNG